MSVDPDLATAYPVATAIMARRKTSPAVVFVSLTTGDVEALMAEVHQMSGAFSIDYIRSEIDAGKLKALVLQRRRRRLSIHPRDYLTWALPMAHAQRSRLLAQAAILDCHDWAAAQPAEETP